MCFTAEVSLATAIFEFLIAAFILLYYRKSPLTKLIPVFIVLLGLYQFTEFMACTIDTIFWTKLGFVTYTFLPALGLEILLRYTGKKHNPVLVFIIPVIVAIVTLSQNVSFESTCGTFFVAARHLFLNPASVALTLAYTVYYFGFIGLTSYLIIKDYWKARARKKKFIYIYALIATIVALLPAVILLVIFPMLYLQFPSIYCEFAVVYSLLALVAYHIEKN